MKVIQMLPALESGGVEQGTVELNRYLSANGHTSIVLSAGGRLVAQIESAGGYHVAWPVGRKRLLTLGYIWKVRRLLERERPDILHLRSRLPAWVGFLAWKGMSGQKRPALVTTVHGFYRVGRYSSVMTRGERVIAVSECIRDYILRHYRDVEPSCIRVIHRGIDPAEYPHGYRPPESWLRKWQEQRPELTGKRLLTLPARITRLKGHEHFFKLVKWLKDRGLPVHGLIVGEAHPRKRRYYEELQELCRGMGLVDAIGFLGHRTDLREILAVSDVVFSLSTEPESFGRTTLEALSLGRPVIGYDHGGVAEQLSMMLPEGAVPVGDWERAAKLTGEWLVAPPAPKSNTQFLLERMLSLTVEVYREVLAAVSNRDWESP